MNWNKVGFVLGFVLIPFLLKAATISEEKFPLKFEVIESHTDSSGCWMFLHVPGDRWAYSVKHYHQFEDSVRGCTVWPPGDVLRGHWRNIWGVGKAIDIMVIQDHKPKVYTLKVFAMHGWKP